MENLNSYPLPCVGIIRIRFQGSGISSFSAVKAPPANVILKNELCTAIEFVNTNSPKGKPGIYQFNANLDSYGFPRPWGIINLIPASGGAMLPGIKAQNPMTFK